MKFRAQASLDDILKNCSILMNKLNPPGRVSKTNNNTDTISYRHITPDSEKHTHHPTHSMEHHLINTLRSPAVLEATLNTLHTTDSIHIKCDNWTPTLPPHPIFTTSNLPTNICRKYTRLHKVNISAVCMIRQITQQLLRAIVRQRTDTIIREISINQLRDVLGYVSIHVFRSTVTHCHHISTKSRDDLNHENIHDYTTTDTRNKR